MMCPGKDFNDCLMKSNLIYKYYKDNRFYHNWDHIVSMLMDLEEYTLDETEKDILEKAIIFHDAVCDPRRNDNEEKSCEIFVKEYTDHNYVLEICDLIRATKDHNKTGEKLNGIIIDLDLAILKTDINSLIDYEHKIFKEYQFTSLTEYIVNRIHFLKSIKEKIGSPNHIDELCDYIKNRNYKIGIYPGSFNPFHVGHKNITEKAEEIFDKVIIARGINPDKEKSSFELPTSLMNEVVIYDGLVTDLFSDFNTCNEQYFLIRGLRNVYDIGYEENLRKFINDIKPNIKLVYLFCDSEFEHISSSQIRSLLKIDFTLAERYLVK